MGYDISAKFNNKAERDAMFDFLEKEQELIKTIFKLDSHTAFNLINPVLKGEDLGSYAPDKHRSTLIGMHGSGIPYSNWALCAWMNVKANCLKKGKNFLFYDDEIMWVDVAQSATQESLKTRNFIVSPNGVAIARPSAAEGIIGKGIEFITKLNKNKYESQQQVAHYLEILDEKYQVHLKLINISLAANNTKTSKQKP